MKQTTIKRNNYNKFLWCLLAILAVPTFLLAILLVRKYSHNETVTQLAALLMLCSFAIHTGFSGSIGFPFWFWFSFSFLSLLISLFFLLRYKENQKCRTLLLSALFMLLTTTFYEAYLACYLAIYLILRSQYDSRLYLDKEVRRKFFKELLPFVICGLLLVTILTQSTNEQVMQDVTRANLRYTQAEKFLQKGKIVMDGDKPDWQTFTLTGKGLLPATMSVSNILYSGVEPVSFRHLPPTPPQGRHPLFRARHLETSAAQSRIGQHCRPAGPRPQGVSSRQRRVAPCLPRTILTTTTNSPLTHTQTYA